MVYAYVKTTPYDSVKYEVDKKTGYLLVDRPQRTSSQPPNLYGFIPLAYCGQRVTALCPRADEGGWRSLGHLRGQRATHRAASMALLWAGPRRTPALWQHSDRLG